jgi:hypothetical protein
LYKEIPDDALEEFLKSEEVLGTCGGFSVTHGLFFSSLFFRKKIPDCFC